MHRTDHQSTSTALELSRTRDMARQVFRKDRGTGRPNVGRRTPRASVSAPGGLSAARERLLRYCARPPLALDRLSVLDNGRICYRIEDAMRFIDGTEDVGQARSELRRRHLPAEPPPLVRARAPDWDD